MKFRGSRKEGGHWKTEGKKERARKKKGSKKREREREGERKREKEKKREGELEIILMKWIEGEKKCKTI